MSRNSVEILEHLSSPQALSAGIVFGKVPAGYTVELENRESPPLFLDAKGDLVAPENRDSERSFAFLNAAPGAQSVFLIDSSGKQIGAIAVPVIAGMGTYLEFSGMHRQSIEGLLLDAIPGADAAKPQLRVGVAGQPSALAQADTQGSFTIPNVVMFRDYPVFLEVFDGQAQELTQRFRYLPDVDGVARLYHFSNSPIEAMVAQLKGGLAPDTGIVIGAFRKLDDDLAASGLRAQVQPFVDEPVLPETYSLSPSGQLLTDQPLDTQFPRFLTVHLPQGGNLAQVQDKDGAVLWSEIVVGTKNVVSVVGPYSIY